MALIIVDEEVKVDLSYQDFINLFTLSKNEKDFGRYVLSPRKDLVVISRNPTSVKDWKDRYFFAKDFFLPRTQGTLGNSLSFEFIFLIVSSNLNILLCFLFNEVYE